METDGVELSEEVLESKDLSTELDAVGDGFKRSATLKHEFDDGRVREAGYARELVGEMWIYPDDSRILELSTRCTKAEAAAVAAETRTFLTGLGIEISAVQETKTRKALDFFSKRLRAGRPSQRSRVAR